MTEDLDRGEALAGVADDVDAIAGDEQRTLTEDQRRTLSARMLVDAAFRRDLLRDPTAAAARLGITLSDWERGEILKFADRIRSIGKTADGMLRQAQVLASGVIPVFVMD